MVRAVRWTEASAMDLVEAAEFISRDSPSYARNLVRDARAAAGSLRDLAERGHVVPESGDPTIREILVDRYRLLYRVEESNVFVLAFVHGARDLRALWSRRDPSR